MSEQTIVIDLSAPTRVIDLPQMARQALEWWLGELAALTPQWLRKRFPRAARPTVLSVRGQIWSIGPAGNPTAAIEIDTSASDKEIADRILTAAPDFSLSRLKVVLPQAMVLRRRVEFPLIAQSELRSAVELQIDRLSPFKSDAVRFDARVLERDPIEGKLLADIAIAPRAPIEQLEQRLAKLGLKAIAIDVETPEGKPAGFTLGASGRVAGSRRASFVTLALVAATGLTWYLAIYAWGAARESETASWQGVIADLRPVAERSAVMRRQLDSLVEPLTIAAVHKPGLVLQEWAEVTRLLPDSVRLTEMRLTADGMEMTGLATDAPGLIQKLEESKYFKDVKFRSPVTRRSDQGRDRFEISMKREMGAPK